MAAAKEPERMGYGYGDIATDVAATEEGGPWPTRTPRRSRWRRWTTTVNDVTAWSDVAPADDAEAPECTNQPLGARICHK